MGSSPVAIKNMEDKIPDIFTLGTNTSLNAKINEAKEEMPSIINLATTTALATVENKIPNVSNLVKKTDYNTKINEIEKAVTDQDHDKYITTLKVNKLTSENFAASLVQANLASKNDIDASVKKTEFDDELKNLNKNVTSNKKKHVLVENELNEISEKVKAIPTKGLIKDLINKFSILNGANYFSLGIFQNYLVFIPAKKYIKYCSGTTRINS